MKRYYAAYGSNLNIEQMSWRCPDAKVIGTAVIQGYKLLFKGSQTGSYLTIEPSVKNHVPIAVWEVSDQDERSLDHYEGFPSFYYKKEMKLPVLLQDGSTKKMKVFVYIMDETRSLGIPSRVYLTTCRKGYREFGFDEQYLHEALERSISHENRSSQKKMPAVR